MEKATESVDEIGEKQQRIWSWGAGTDGQLATGSLQDEHRPQIVRSLSLSAVTSLACGGAHVIALLPGGGVVSWGRGTSGQLGHAQMVNCLDPEPIRVFEGIPVTYISAGWNHSAFVSADGALFTCGDGSFGQLGHGNYDSQCLPLKVSYFSSKHAEQVACGMRHTLVLLSDNAVYAFGSGKRGQLGITNDKVASTSHPQMTLGLTDLRIARIRANGDHSAALSADGTLYTWGRGFASGSDELLPCHMVTTLCLDDVALGWNHALLLTREGQVFMLGGDRHGKLAHPQMASGKPKERMLQLIPSAKVLQVAAGAEHSAIVTDSGCVLTWGWGEHGQLGLGNTDDQSAPQVVSLSRSEHSIPNVYCGSGFCIVSSRY